MLTEPMTLYKLMNLYMLKQVNFPLTNAQLTNFFTEHEYTTYFTLQQALNELEDAGLVHKEASHNSTRYDITKEGEETLNFFGKNISSAIIEDMDQYLKENKFRLREEVGTTADFYRGTNQDYIVHCEVRENKTTLIRLDLSVPDKEQAETMCNAWKTKSQEIYAHVMRTSCPEPASKACRYSRQLSRSLPVLPATAPPLSILSYTDMICSFSSSSICLALSPGFFSQMSYTVPASLYPSPRFRMTQSLVSPAFFRRWILAIMNRLSRSASFFWEARCSLSPACVSAPAFPAFCL